MNIKTVTSVVVPLKSKFRLFSIICILLTAPCMAVEFDIVIANGRVIDPETGLDAIRHVGILESRIAEVSTKPLEGNRTIDATGLVVAPGFIDLHVHGQSEESGEYKAHDGVTTALDLESGRQDLRTWLASKEGKSLINYGASVSHRTARTAAMVKFASKLARLDELTEEHGTDHPDVRNYRMEEIDSANYDTLTLNEIQKMNRLVEEELYAGGIGIGLLLGYLPGASHEEIFRLFENAAGFSAPVFVHVRSPGIVGIQEVMTDAISWNTPLHIVHINSASLGKIDFAIDLVEAAQDRGFDVTTEMYPYTAGSTGLQSSIFDEGWQESRNISYGDLQWVKTGERLNRETFEKYRAEGGTVIIHMMKEPWIQNGLRRKSTMIASDSMPYAPGAHPRSAGAYARVLGKYVREEKVLSLPQAIRKMTLMPAQRLETFVPAAARKGRIQVGADADITIFDPEIVIDKATFEGGLKFSEGIPYVLINGTLVVDGSKTVEGVAPGEALMGKYRR
ncbi:MAG: amidohydrolase family protein [Verrucomicrobia bacterium]|nr:amidohydrolase family protein [Verrucomicrobiota bacterium]